MYEFIIAPLCFFIDQYTKYQAEKHLSKTGTKKVMNGNINLKVLYNKGAFLGLLKNKRGLLLIFNVLSIIFLIIITIVAFMQKGSHLLKIGLGFLFGGALGNLYDRVARKRVVDFFSFKIKPNIYFNFADMFVFLGGLLLILESIFNYRSK